MNSMRAIDEYSRLAGDIRLLAVIYIALVVLALPVDGPARRRTTKRTVAEVVQWAGRVIRHRGQHPLPAGPGSRTGAPSTRRREESYREADAPVLTVNKDEL